MRALAETQLQVEAGSLLSGRVEESGKQAAKALEVSLETKKAAGISRRPFFSHEAEAISFDITS